MPVNDHSYVIPTMRHLPYGLGRHVHHDPANEQHRALDRPPDRAEHPNQAWRSTVVWDQGNSSRCTAEAATGLLRTQPYASQFTGRAKFDEPAERQAAYLRWQQYDPWHDTPHDGSSVDAPFQGLRAEGEITEWRWLFGEGEVREWVTWYSPVVVGTIWRWDMFTPDADGFVIPTGDIAGGHAYRLVQYSDERDAYRIVNSWGRGWGDNGRAWIRAEHLDQLLRADGDAATL